METITIDFALPELSAKDREQLERLATLEAAERRKGVDGADMAASAEKGAEDDPRWRKEILASIPPVQVLRLTVGRCNYLDRGHYYDVWREGNEWYAQATGVDADAVPPDRQAVYLRMLVRQRAEILAALPRKGNEGTTVYVCQRAFVPYDHLLAYEGDPDVGLVPEDVIWEEAYLPPEWTALGALEPASAGGMGEEMPVELFDLLVEATRKLNRGVLPTISAFFDQTRPLWSVRSGG